MLLIYQLHISQKQRRENVGGGTFPLLQDPEVCVWLPLTQTPERRPLFQGSRIGGRGCVEPVLHCLVSDLLSRFPVRSSEVG